ncbi:hypothetical protein SAMN05216256_11257 [Halopseudomonas pachastrellae]|nr:hypothetical protein SAMN05216256_11257 [Halopseudomonas pachastrellae]
MVANLELKSATVFQDRLETVYIRPYDRSGTSERLKQCERKPLTKRRHSKNIKSLNIHQGIVTRTKQDDTLLQIMFFNKLLKI